MTAAIARHIRFYVALVCGLAAFMAAKFVGMTVPALAACDVFYVVFLALCVPLVLGNKPVDLRRRAKSEDEGIIIVVLVTMATILFFCEAVFVALNHKHGLDLMPLLLAGIGAPLGWLTLHTIMAFHYADIHYFDDPDCAGDEKDLLFPGGADPGPWDFLYYAFVVGMTAQVSDVQITTTVMRRATLYHGILSFFFNTVLIAMAVNAGIAIAS
jgi:uncharacterized membrane protein